MNGCFRNNLRASLRRLLRENDFLKGLPRLPRQELLLRCA